MDIKRRDFMKACAGTAVGLGVGQFMNPSSDATAVASTAANTTKPLGQSLDPAPLSVPPIQAQKNADGNYNVLFVVVDQEHHFPSYPEGTNYQARELLAKLGTSFEKHYNCSNMSTSSRSVMYTGQHTPHTKMLDNTDLDWQGPLSPDMTTIGDMMTDAGYYAAYKGKFHMGNASIFATDKSNELTDLTDYGFHDWDVECDYIGTALEGYNEDEEICTDAIAWLEKQGKPLNASGKSFFLAVNLINPHDVMYYDTSGYKTAAMPLALEPDDPDYQKDYARPLPSTVHQDLTDPSLPPVLMSYKTQWETLAGPVNGDEDWRNLRNFYYNSIQDNDNRLSVVLQYLADNGLFDNTIVIFTADHGEMEGEHNLKGKGGFIYENNVHVPLIIAHPDHAGGAKVTALTSHMDLAPTFVDMASLPDAKKAEITKGLTGHSLMPLMDGSGKSVRDTALFCYDMFSFVGKEYKDSNGQTRYDTSGRGFVRAVFTDRYKFARYFACTNYNNPEDWDDLLANNDIELYDLQNDPTEIHNLAGFKEENKELILHMNTLLQQSIAREIGVDDGSTFREIMQAYVARLQSVVS